MPELNQQLIDWVKENKAKNFSDEQLLAHLTQNGYSAEVAQSAISAANSPTPNMPAMATPSQNFSGAAMGPSSSGSGSMMKIIIGLVVGLVIVGGALFFWLRSSDTQGDVATDTPTAPAVEKKLCADLACFEAALQTCDPSDFTYDEGGEIINFSINGKSGELCAFDYTMIESSFRAEGRGLTMSCLHDAQYPFDSDLSLYFNCRGPLAETFLGKLDESLFPLRVEKSESSGEGFSISMEYLTGYDCGSSGCFENKFKTCEAAKQYVNAMGMGLLTEIIGMKDGACELKVSAPKVPAEMFPDNTFMTCLLDNSKDYQTAYQEALSANKCQGDLAMLFGGTAMNSGSMSSDTEELSMSAGATGGEYADAQRYWHMANVYEALNDACDDEDDLDLSGNTSTTPLLCNVTGSYGPFFGIKFSKIKDPAFAAADCSLNENACPGSGEQACNYSLSGKEAFSEAPQSVVACEARVNFHLDGVAGRNYVTAQYFSVAPFKKIISDTKAADLIRGSQMKALEVAMKLACKDKLTLSLAGNTFTTPFVCKASGMPYLNLADFTDPAFASCGDSTIACDSMEGEEACQYTFMDPQLGDVYATPPTTIDPCNYMIFYRTSGGKGAYIMKLGDRFSSITPPGTEGEDLED